MKYSISTILPLATCAALLLIACQQEVPDTADTGITVSETSSGARRSVSTSASMDSGASLVFEDAGLRFQYDSKYSVLKNASANNGLFIVLKSEDVIPRKAYDPEPPGSGFEEIIISISENSKNLSLQQIVAELSSEDFVPDTIGGEQAARYQFSSLHDSNIVTVLHNGKIYQFSTYENNGREEDFSNILKSVQFID